MRIALVAAVVITALGCKSESFSETEVTYRAKKRDAGTSMPKIVPGPKLDEMFKACFEKNKGCTKYAEASAVACERRDYGCAGHALTVHYLGLMGAIDVKSAQAEMIKSCDQNHHKPACIAERYLFADAWLERKMEQFRDIIERGCAKDNLVACSNLAWLLYKRGGDEARAKSKELAERSCGGDVGIGCMVAGVHAHQAKDLDRARRLSTRACELGSELGCFNAAILVDGGKGGPKDPKEVERLVGRACELGHFEACQKLDRMAPWIGYKSHPSAEVVGFDRSEGRGMLDQHMAKVKLRQKLHLKLVLERDEYSVQIRYGKTKAPIGKFPRYNRIEVFAVDGYLYLHNYTIRRDGKILATDGFKIRAGADELEPVGIAEGKGRLDYRTASYVRPKEGAP